MKKDSVKGKLSLNKETIAKLSNDEISNVNGASGNPCTVSCTCGCPTATACTGGTNTFKQYCCVPPCW